MYSLESLSAVHGMKVAVPAAPLTRHLARVSSDRPALVYTDETSTVQISYEQLHSRSNALAKVIASRARPTGVNRDGDYVVAVCMQHTHNTILTLLATWKAGAAYVPLEPSFPQARVRHILKDTEPALVVYDVTANTHMFVSSGVPAVSFEELCQESAGVSEEEPADQDMLAPASSDSIAIVVYTSGSTGVPKGVRLTYSAICNRLWWQFRTFPYCDSEATCVWKTALTFLDSVCEIWGPLLQGRTLLVLGRETTRDPQKLVQVLDEYQVQRLVLVPTLLSSILMYLSLHPSQRPLQLLKLWVCSGETLSKALATKFFKYFGNHAGYKLANFYGSTEVMGDVLYFVLERSGQLDLYPTIPIGVPLDNCAVYLLDAEMGATREAEAGEVWVAGANLAAGYVGGQASEKFTDNPYATRPEFRRLYRTGDFGVLHKDVILYAGRTDSQIKIRGHRVDLQEVERAVASVQGVDKAVVLSYSLDQDNSEILAFVTINSDARLSASHVEAALKNSLTYYMIPQVIVIEDMPLLVNGKVDRQSLLKMYENANNNDDTPIALDCDYSGVEPEELEAARALLETVGEVLGRAARGAVSIRAGFYELGGNSLNTIYTITRLRDKGYYIDICDFLEAANLGEVLSHLSTSPGGAEDKASKFTAVPMRDEHKKQIIDMIVSSFYEKAVLKQQDEIQVGDYAACIGVCWLALPQPGDYANFIDACWPALLNAKLSVVIEDRSGSPVAVALNFDASDEPKIELAGGLAKSMAFLENIESSVRDTMLPKGKGAILHSFMMATAACLSARDNVAAIYALEHATVRLARERRFQGVFATNTSPLTQQLGTVLGFQTLLDYQINQYTDANGKRPFGKVADDMRALVCWKPVD